LVSRHQKGKPLWILLEQEMMGWQWHQLDHMQIICTSLQTDNDASTSPLRFLQAGCPSCCPANSVKALKAKHPLVDSVQLLSTFAVQELFAECGADKADDAPWLKLGEIHLSHNGLTELGASLVNYLTYVF